jgi:hypothetical protein
MPQEAAMNNLQYHYAKQHMEELHQRAEKERLLKPYRLSWRVRSARALHGLARRLEPNENTVNENTVEAIS